MGALAAAGIAAAGGLASSFLGSQNKAQNVTPNVYNMYGQANTPNTGAISSMGNIFGALNGGGFSQAQGASQNYANSLISAASNPGIGSIYNYAQNELNGNNLQNPLVSQYAQQAYQGQVAQGANNAARQRASAARAGMGFSTANQQASDADMAAASASGSQQRSQILSQNEQFERGLQQQAPGLLSSAIGMPSSYLGQVNNALYAPYQSQAGITSTLTGGNPNVSQAQLLQQPNFSQQLAGGLNTGVGLYNLYNQFGQPNGQPSTPTGSNDD